MVGTQETPEPEEEIQKKTRASFPAALERRELGLFLILFLYQLVNLLSMNLLNQLNSTMINKSK